MKLKDRLEDLTGKFLRHLVDDCKHGPHYFSYDRDGRVGPQIQRPPQDGIIRHRDLRGEERTSVAKYLVSINATTKDVYGEDNMAQLFLENAFRYMGALKRDGLIDCQVDMQKVVVHYGTLAAQNNRKPELCLRKHDTRFVKRILAALPSTTVNDLNGIRRRLLEIATEWRKVFEEGSSLDYIVKEKVYDEEEEEYTVNEGRLPLAMVVSLVSILLMYLFDVNHFAN